MGEDDLDVVTWTAGGWVRSMHIYPRFAFVGVLCCFALGLWLVIAVPYSIVRRRDIEPWDWLMMAGAVMVIVALAIPDAFFASSD